MAGRERQAKVFVDRVRAVPDDGLSSAKDRLDRLGESGAAVAEELDIALGEQVPGVGKGRDVLPGAAAIRVTETPPSSMVCIA
ncbi:hypothetical protein GCM10022255_007660 [Dactylosporangium darangshiense]|uniref:Uncharacterized protein n=1 Tax=Dactylosporangium darangshiense TaxID=579108 RepID=A0ABP8CX28_9ACTN